MFSVTLHVLRDCWPLLFPSFPPLTVTFLSSQLFCVHYKLRYGIYSSTTLCRPLSFGCAGNFVESILIILLHTECRGQFADRKESTVHLHYKHQWVHEIIPAYSESHAKPVSTTSNVIDCCSKWYI
jgi:hypothetical protein